MAHQPLPHPTPQEGPSQDAVPAVRGLARATPLDATESFPQINTGRDHQGFGSIDPTLIKIDVKKDLPKESVVLERKFSRGNAWEKTKQFLIQEAPGWTLSMAIHAVTLVTMATIAVPDAKPIEEQRLVVAPAPEEKVKETKDAAAHDLPTTLDEVDITEAVTFDSPKDPSEKKQEGLEIQPADEVGSAAAVDLSDFGLDHVPKGDLLTMVGAYSGMELSARGAAAKAQMVLKEGGNEVSEKAVTTALRWIANHQMQDGSWSFDHTLAPTCRGQCRNPGKMVGARNAATAMALLPLLGTGQTHVEGKYRTTIRRGLAYLVEHMKVGAQGGALNEPESSMYAHGLAAIVLCEAFAMTHDESLREPAQKAVDFICFAQDAKGGGWRYKPRQAGDTSVVGWQLMALKSGYMGGLKIPTLTVHRASLFLDSVESDGGANYGYTSPNTGGEGTTAIGLLCRMYLGWKKDNPALQRGIQYLCRHGPSGSNMYYNYYATQVMRHWEGETWMNWNRQMRDQLVHAQAKQGHEEGSWFSGTGDNGAAPGGRLYCTAMAAMILEVYYRHMPIYRAQSVTQDFPD